MSRYVLCKPCKEDQESKVKRFDKDQGYVAVFGTALKSMNCDWCNIEIPRGSICFATTVYRLVYNDYKPWENETIQPIASVQ